MEIFLALMKVLQFLPSVVSLVESIHPAATPGAAKLTAAMGVVNSLLPAVGASVLSAPEGQTHLVTAINAIVTGLNASGMMPTPAAAAPAPQSPVAGTGD